MDKFDIVKRSGKVAFYQVPDSESYTRMQGFTSLSVSKNPEEYKP